MEFDELLITTGVDALVRLVKEKKRIRLIEASKQLGISEEAIEDWARVLEEEGILKIEYHLSKVYLVWIQPTVEEVKKERKSFYEEKKGIKKEISDIRGRVKTDLGSLRGMEDSFERLYKQLYPKLESLEKMVRDIPTQKGKGVEAESIDKLVVGLRDIKGRISTMEMDIGSASQEMQSLRKQLDVKAPKTMDTEKVNADVETLLQELESIEKKVNDVTDAIPEGVSVKDIKDRFNELKKDFNDIRKRNSSLRMEMENLKETSEILTSIEKSMKKYTGDVSNMKTEIGILTKSLNDVRKKSDDISNKLKKDMDAMERFSDSIDVARSIMTKFPSQKELSEEMKRIEKIESGIGGKINSVEKLMKAVSPATSVKDFAELQKTIAQKKRVLAVEMKDMSEAVRKESATFETYQSIRDRVVKSLDDYNSQLTNMRKELKTVSAETTEVDKELKGKVENLKKQMAEKGLQATLKQTEDIKRKKKLIDEIALSMKSLSATANNLNKRLDLLGKQAAILEIRGGSGVPPKSKEEAEVKHQLKLTKEEQVEFKQKREELRKLIKKLWEES